MIVTPTLHFHGQCEEAIRLYQQAFGCRIGTLLHYSDADARDWSAELTEAQKHYVYHAEIFVGEQRIMMSDEIGLPAGAPASVFLTVTFPTAPEVRQAFAVLEQGGTVIYPLRSTTYSSCMGSLIDPYGFRWGLMTEQTER